MKSTKGRHRNPKNDDAAVMNRLFAAHTKPKRRVMPKLIANKITGVSPMTAPSSTITSLRKKRKK